MTWPSRFLIVPTGRLRQDGELMASAKASPAQMRAYMAALPAVHDQVRAGATPAQLAALRQSGDPQLRAAGDAYHHLFTVAGSPQRLEAELSSDGTLVVARGRHRVEAARELGIAGVPVHVRAPDEPTLDAVERSCDAERIEADPVVDEARRTLDDEHRADRGPVEQRSARPTGGGASRAAPSRPRSDPTRAPELRRERP